MKEKRLAGNDAMEKLRVNLVDDEVLIAESLSRLIQKHLGERAEVKFLRMFGC